MKIIIVKGIGEGQTKLSAFDAALQDAGVSNYNLIRLSSVIPPNSVIEKKDSYITPPEDWGHKLYIVQAEERGDIKGKGLACGIGWFMIGDKGLFVEHETSAENEETAAQEIRTLITKSLHDLCINRDIKFDEKEVQMEITSTTVADKPKCVLTLAIYKTENWD